MKLIDALTRILIEANDDNLEINSIGVHLKTPDKDGNDLIAAGTFKDGELFVRRVNTKDTPEKVKAKLK